MPFFRSSAAAFRASGLVAVLLSLLPIGGAIWSVRAVGVDLTLVLMLVNVVVTLVPGVLALFGRSHALLPVAFGWLLASSLPKLLMVPLQMDLLRKLSGTIQTSSFVGPYAYWGTLCMIEGVGLALYFVGVHRQDQERKI